MRANRTWLCARCAIRFDAAPGAAPRPCPKCDVAREIFDGADPAARLEAREALLSRARRAFRARLFGHSFAVPLVTSWSPERAGSAMLTIARGTARGEERLRAPLSRTPCLAWRLYGEGPTGALDEAGATSFALDGDPEGPCEIDADAIVVALALGEPPRVLDAPGPPLLELLARFFAYPTEGALRLGEVVLRAGDRAEIEGAC
ncbi:MAG: hypothetical protein M3Y87_22590, partial [Myxococcota bacterium]|nr:hypothetical protein [Myxococcota bacterium]